MNGDDLVRKFQRDYVAHGNGEVVGEVGGQTRRALMLAHGQCLACDLAKGSCFSYPGSFKIYEALSDAVPDTRIGGKVVLPVTDHGLREDMLTRLDAGLICTLHQRPVTWGFSTI